MSQSSLGYFQWLELAIKFVLRRFGPSAPAAVPHEALDVVSESRPPIVRCVKSFHPVLLFPGVLRLVSHERAEYPKDSKAKVIAIGNE